MSDFRYGYEILQTMAETTEEDIEDVSDDASSEDDLTGLGVLIERASHIATQRVQPEIPWDLELLSESDDDGSLPPSPPRSLTRRLLSLPPSSSPPLRSRRRRYFSKTFPSLSSRLRRFRHRVAREVFGDAFVREFETSRGDPDLPLALRRRQNSSSSAVSPLSLPSSSSSAHILDTIICLPPPAAVITSPHVTHYSQIAVSFGIPLRWVPEYMPQIPLVEVLLKFTLALEAEPDAVVFPYADESLFYKLMQSLPGRKLQVLLRTLLGVFREEFPKCRITEMDQHCVLPSLFGDLVGNAFRKVEMRVFDDLNGSRHQKEILDFDWISFFGSKFLIPLTVFQLIFDYFNYCKKKIEKKDQKKKRFETRLEFIYRVKNQENFIISSSSSPPFNHLFGLEDRIEIEGDWRSLSLVSQDFRKATFRSFRQLRLTRRNFMFIPIQLLRFLPSVRVDFHPTTCAFGISAKNAVAFRSFVLMKQLTKMVFVGGQSLLQALFCLNRHRSQCSRLSFSRVIQLRIEFPKTRKEFDFDSNKNELLLLLDELEIISEGMFGFEEIICRSETSAFGLPPTFRDAWAYIRDEDRRPSYQLTLDRVQRVLFNSFPNVRITYNIPLEFCGRWKSLSKVSLLESEFMSSNSSNSDSALLLPISVNRLEITFNLLWSRSNEDADSETSTTILTLQMVEKWIASKEEKSLNTLVLRMQPGFTTPTRVTDFERTPLLHVSNLLIDAGKQGPSFENVFGLDSNSNGSDPQQHQPRSRESIRVINLQSFPSAMDFLRLENVDVLDVDVLFYTADSLKKARFDPIALAESLDVRNHTHKRLTLRDSRSSRLSDNGVHLPYEFFSSCCVYEILVAESRTSVSFNWRASDRFVETMFFLDRITLEDYEGILREYFRSKIAPLDGIYAVASDPGASVIPQAVIRLIGLRRLRSSSLSNSVPSDFSLSLCVPVVFDHPLLEFLSSVSPPFHFDEEFATQVWKTPWISVFLQDLSGVLGSNGVVPKPETRFLRSKPIDSRWTRGTIEQKYHWRVSSDSFTPSMVEYRLQSLLQLKEEANGWITKHELTAKRKYSSILSLLTQWEMINNFEVEQLQDAAELNVSLCYFRLREYHFCIRHCDNVIERDPSCFKAHFRAGYSCMKLNKMNLALRYARRAVALEPRNERAVQLVSIITNQLKKGRVQKQTGDV